VPAWAFFHGYADARCPIVDADLVSLQFAEQAPSLAPFSFPLLEIHHG
jgi:hypothetical protein